jgi:2-hydroxychromene-2-carboxylate isomerase
VEPSPTAGQLSQMGPRKRANYINDLLHWVELCGAEISRGAREVAKSDSRPALRAAMVAQEMGRFREFHYPAYRALWSEARDLSRREVLAELFEGAGIDAEVALARAESEELERRLQEQTRAAIDRGVFGVPTLFVADEMFWGNDRLELVRFHIERAREGC